MTFGEKLRTLRKKTGMSQEKLAEKLNDSRQAVTKWETESGIPDIENIMAVSALFSISIDELLSNENGRFGSRPPSSANQETTMGYRLYSRCSACWLLPLRRSSPL